MAENLPDTNVGNIKYINKQDAVNVVANTAKIVASFNYQYAIDALLALTPADVVQVVHGRWIKVGVWGRVYKCNQCGNFLDFDGVNAGRGSANFCPNCMAKMDGERKE